MHEAEIRARIRERLKSGALPRMLPASPLKSGLPTGAASPFRPVTRGYPFHIAGFHHTSRLRLRDQHKPRAEIS